MGTVLGILGKALRLLGCDRNTPVATTTYNNQWLVIDNNMF